MASPTASILDVKSVKWVHEQSILVFVTIGVQPSDDQPLVFVFQYKQFGVRIGLGHSKVLYMSLDEQLSDLLTSSRQGTFHAPGPV